MGKEKETVFKVQINYKTGKSVIMTVTNMGVIVSGTGKLEEVKYSIPSGCMLPLHFGINDVESIWQLEDED